MNRIILCVLMVMVLLSLGCLSCGGQVTSSLNMQNPDQARASETEVINILGDAGKQVTSSLNMQNPDQARASEMVVIKIIDDSGKPVLGVRIYSPEYLGDTAKDGSLVTFFKKPGDYELVARKGKTGEPGFAETKGMISIIPSPIELQNFEGISPLLPPGETYTGEQHYKPGMIVRFSVKNTSDTEIILNNSSPWKIQSREEEIVFEPIALQAIVHLAPGEHKEWTWNQKDEDDRQVSDGGYMVILKCSMGEYGLRFWIVPEGMMP